MFIDYKMKKRDLQELQTKEVAELQKLLLEKKTEIARLKLELTTGKHKNVHVLKNARRTLAQIATILRHKQSLSLRDKETQK